MERATPVEMRRSLELVDQLKKAGIAFVPIPIDDDAKELYILLNNKLDDIEKSCE